MLTCRVRVGPPVRRGAGSHIKKIMKEHAMKIIQEEQNGIVCITINSRMGTELSPELEKTILIFQDLSSLVQSSVLTQSTQSTQ